MNPAGTARAIACTLLVGGSASAPAIGAAQVLGTPADSAALATVATHIDAERFDSARAALEQWREGNSAAAREMDRAAADLLGARLERDGVAAQHAYLSVALAHPFGSAAGLALLRVGQAAVLQGDTAAATVYLTRLIDDFPGGGHQAEAHLWLSRSHFLAGRGTAACETARSGLAIGAPADVLQLLRIQEERACAPPPPDRTAAAAAEDPDGRFSVQTGAFRARVGADALAARLRREGLEPRLVRVPGSELMRVRVGTFAVSSGAVALRDRLRAAGFDAVVVSDAGRESPVP